MATKNIKQQMFFALDKRFNVGQGRKKHNDKKNHTNQQQDIIYSTNEYNRLKDMAKNFNNWVKDKHPELNHAELGDIRAETFEEFLQEKVEKCSQNTLTGYKDSIAKLGRCCATVYQIKDKISDWQYINAPVSQVEGKPGRTIRPTRELLEEALKCLRDGSKSKIAIELESRFALRDNEAVWVKPKDIDFERMELTVEKGKGNKKRVLPIRIDDVPFLKKIVEGVSDDRRIANISAKSVQKSMRDMWSYYDKKYGTNMREIFADNSTEGHSVRKLRATEMYNEKVYDTEFELIKSKLMQKLNLQQETAMELDNGKK